MIIRLLKHSHRLVRTFVSAAVLLACVWSLLSQGSARAAGPRVLPEGQVPNDQRLEPLKDLNGYFPFEPPSSREAWQDRATELRRRFQPGRDRQ